MPLTVLLYRRPNPRRLQFLAVNEIKLDRHVNYGNSNEQNLDEKLLSHNVDVGLKLDWTNMLKTSAIPVHDMHLVIRQVGLGSCFKIYILTFELLAGEYGAGG